MPALLRVIFKAEFKASLPPSEKRTEPAASMGSTADADVIIILVDKRASAT
jgi:hypothetical protein